MINNAFPYRFFTNLIQNNGRLPLPHYLKDVIKKREVAEVSKLEDFFIQELQQASFETEESVSYFLFLTQEALSTSFYRRDFVRFESQMEIIRHRLIALRSLDTSRASLQALDQFFEMIEAGILRLIKHTAIEDFENHISELDWTIFDKQFIAQVSNILGFVYLHEENHEQKQKGRIWLMKAMGEFGNDERLSTSLFMAMYFIHENKPESIQQLNQIIAQIEAQHKNLVNQELGFLHQGALLELEAASLCMKFEHEMTSERYEEAQLLLKEFETKYAQQSQFPEFLQAKILRMLAFLYGQLNLIAEDEVEKASLAKNSLNKIEQAIEKLTLLQDENGLHQYKLDRTELAIQTQSSQTEKEMKELLQFFKKKQDYPTYLSATHTFAGLHANNQATHKSYDLIQDIFKLGQKKVDHRGFFLLYEGLRLANVVFLRESKQPGVSWMVEILDAFFEKVLQTTRYLDAHLDLIGRALAENFRQACIEFEPVSHFNIKVYFQYQLLEVELIRLGAKLTGDELGLKIADKLLTSLSSKNNPLNFIHAEWTEFKDVPNAVRNKTLNKCIDITKGDLPGAANHLDFSYRNLRSYITFKEVNRLGFFLDLQETNNRQLELGIRYMFYDLYKQGTIFEVVFDMPKFLVKYSKDGFFSQDLEQELNIKGTTAKKYIKIMMENGIIRQDKAAGRRHYYRLVRENVMNRLGKDQNTLIESAQ